MGFSTAFLGAFHGLFLHDACLGRIDRSKELLKVLLQNQVRDFEREVAHEQRVRLRRTTACSKETMGPSLLSI